MSLIKLLSTILDYRILKIILISGLLLYEKTFESQLVRLQSNYDSSKKPTVSVANDVGCMSANLLVSKSDESKSQHRVFEFRALNEQRDNFLRSFKSVQSVETLERLVSVRTYNLKKKTPPKIDWTVI